MAAMFIVPIDGSFASEPVVTWRSKVPHCFSPTRPGGGLVGPRLTFVVYIPRTKNVEAFRLNDFS